MPGVVLFSLVCHNSFNGGDPSTPQTMHNLTHPLTLAIRYRDNTGSAWSRFTTTQELTANIRELWAEKATIESIAPAFPA